MPLYSDPGYFYSGGGYTPYYSSNPYSSYAGYSRALAGTYIVPTSRANISTSRYKPKLTPISELPLSSRGLTSLTRIQSPKISYHTSPKFVPPRPIHINAADIDVSAKKYPNHEPPSENTTAARASAGESQPDVNNNDVSENSGYMPRIDGSDPAQTRNTIKRGRAVVRLSIMRPKSKEVAKNENTEPPPSPRTRSRPREPSPEKKQPQKTSWRDNFGEDLFPKSKDFTRKTPGELLLERHIIRDRQKAEDEHKNFVDLSKTEKTTKEEEVNPLMKEMEAIKRLSISKCPSFHEICEDISSDKIDDDLNAGELRRRASLIQEQEMEIINELQKSGSGIFELILERNASQDDCRRSSKRKSKKGKKIRHKITASVHIDDIPQVTITPAVGIKAEVEGSVNHEKTPPKISFSVDKVEEDHTIHTVVVLPKKKPKVKKSETTSAADKEKIKTKEAEKESKPVEDEVLKEDRLQSNVSDAPKPKEDVKPKVEEQPKLAKVEEVHLPQPKTKIESSEKTTAKAEELPKKTVEPVEKEAKSSVESTEKLPKNEAKVIQNEVLSLSKLSESASKNLKPRVSASVEVAKTVSSDLPKKIDEAPKIVSSPSSKDIPAVTVKLPGKKQPLKAVNTDIKPEIKKPIESTLNKKTDMPIAKPKPIKKVQKSDSGEDFWSQIGTRETLYMTNRKKILLESQWKKREDLLEDEDVQNANDSKNLEEIKTAISSQKSEALKEAAHTHPGENAIKRSESNESALSQTTKQSEIAPKKSILAPKLPEKTKEEEKPLNKVADKPSNKSNNNDVKAVCDKKISPKKSVATTSAQEKAVESQHVTSTAPLTSTKAAALSSTAPATTATDRTAPKINAGLQAKSPESKVQQQILKNTKEQQTAQPTAEEKPKETVIKRAEKVENDVKSQTKQASPTKGGQQIKCSAFNESGSVQEDTGVHSAITSTPKSSDKTTSVDGGQRDNGKISANEIGSSKESNKIQSGSKNLAERLNETQEQLQEQKQQPLSLLKTLKPIPTTTATPQASKTSTATTTQTKTSTATTATVPTPTTITAKTTTTTTTTKSPPTIKNDDASKEDHRQTSNITSETQISISNQLNAANTASTDTRDENFPTANSNSLTKFPTVSNLSQCLLDVDAELEDYIPSEPEYSSDEDSSSCSSCNRSSMKKKCKHHQKKKEKDNKFDPNKKIKLDHKKKLYVKEEAPLYPLIATPRPLWKREKFNYSKDSDSDSEETDSDSECSTSDESGDELNPSKDGITSLRSDIRLSTCSNDSGFDGGTAPASPKKMLETSYTFAQFQRSGRITAPATIIPRFKKYSVEDFHFLAVLGKGSFGKVLLAELRNTDYCYAVKCLKKDVVLEDDDVECTLIERKVLALGTKHPYLCHLFCTFQTESHLFFVMEYLNGGDLMFHIQQSGRFPEPRARFYAAEIISGLKFLHKKGIIYRDLKLDNVLLDFDGHVRIADFGMCKLQIYLDKTADSFCGTPDYMAPEIIKGDKYNQNVDWWSFGVLLYEMLIGQSPFSGCDEDELFWSICNEMPWFPIYITKEATSILKGLLEKDSNMRIGSQYSPGGDICDHTFFRDIDWNRLERRGIDPPFKPQVKHPLDTKYFDKTFTRERVRLTPIDKDILQSMDQAQFEGFSYTNPNATLN